MTDQTPNVMLESGSDPPAIEPVPVVVPVNASPTSPGHRKSHKTLWIIVASVIGTLCLCGIAVVAVAVQSGIKVFQEKAPVTTVLDSFMHKMTAKDTQGAYELFSPRAQRQVPMSEVEKLIQGNNYVLFDGYRGLVIDNLNLTAAVNTNPDVPQGTVADVAATVSYEGGFTGKLTGTLEKVDGIWMIDRFYIVVPPDKFKP